jgi:N-acetylmuramoyl-L-alanine amidase|tara:strand:+ start:293 stop:1036 length:744 start_codon:yes stop_codon:yes gene_type:complete
MAIKTSSNYSPNFNPEKRKANQIKFLIFHYTGMSTEKAAIKRLTNIRSEVSSHYLINQTGKIINLVPDLYIAWHAGRSKWKKYESLNKNSIGIEITNPGHSFGYKKFPKQQILSLIQLTKFLIRKYKINKKNILGHSDIAPERKKDPGEKFPWQNLAKNQIGYWHKIDQKTQIKNRMVNINDLQKKIFYKNVFKIGYSKKNSKNLKHKKNNYLIKITKAFQRRFRPAIVNGKIDKECLIISQNLIKQ